MTKLDNGEREALRHGIARSDKWPAVEKAHKLLEPVCQCCGNEQAAVQVHHIFPFHYCIALGRPDLELDHRNLISLCETEKGRPSQNHHLLIGHLDDFKSSNINVVRDAREIYKNRMSAFIQNSDTWKTEKQNRLKLLDEMSADEKAAFRKSMDDTYPVILNEL